MDLRLVRYFVATVDAGSATRAAAQLNITQPVLSRQLRQLQRDLRVELFELSGRRLTLTRAGHEFLPLARRLLGESAEVERTMADLAAGALREIRIAVPSTTFSDVLAPFLATLHPSDPLPVVTRLNLLDATAALERGSDLAIGSHRPEPGLAGRALGVVPVWAYAAASPADRHPRRITLAHLVRRRLILLSPPYRQRELFDHAVEADGLAYSDWIECDDPRVAQALAAAGRGTAVISDDPRFGMVPMSIGVGRNGRGGQNALSMTLYASWRQSHHASELLGRFADRLATFCEHQYPEQPHLR